MGQGPRAPPVTWATVGLLLVTAGCLAPQEALEAMPVAQAPVDVVDLGGSGCRTQALFLLVPYATSDPWLPAGFYPADLSEFTPYTVVLSGQTGAFVATLECETSRLDGGPLATSFIGFFVEPPEAPGNNGQATYNFYTVAHLTQDEALRGVLEGWGWRVEELAHRMDLKLSPELPAPPGAGRGTWYASEGSVEAAAHDGDWFLHSGQAVYPQDFAAGALLRFWHDTPGGLAYLEYKVPFRTIAAGPVDCAITPGTLLADMTGRTGDTCNYLDSFVLHFPPHDLEGQGRFLGGRSR
ncbi:MAG: hypothetical protein ACPGQL_09465 [Thermoplasmatota archaeon]